MLTDLILPNSSAWQQPQPVWCQGSCGSIQDNSCGVSACSSLQPGNPEVGNDLTQFHSHLMTLQF